MTKQLGHFIRVEPREIWRNEAQDFTPWLAREENLAVLSETLGLDLELEAEERDVGPFRADILCKDTVDDNWVLIENQLERTDHTHLGQLLTYAAGLQAVTVIWISTTFTQEHRAALDWLNEVTNGRIRFFGLEVELWRIDESPPAPKFNVISKPNEWSRSVSAAARRIDSEELTELRKRYVDYWTGFVNYLAERNSLLRPQTPRPQQWLSFALGRSGFHLSATISEQNGTIGANFVVNRKDGNAYYSQIEKQRSEIEQEIGFNLEWSENAESKQKKVEISRRDVDLTDASQWEDCWAWTQERLEKMSKALRPRIRALRLSDDSTDAPGAHPL